jgi:hypothetical protein
MRNPYFGDFWEAMTWIMSKSLALLQWSGRIEARTGVRTANGFKALPLQTSATAASGRKGQFRSSHTAHVRDGGTFTVAKRPEIDHGRYQHQGRAIY